MNNVGVPKNENPDLYTFTIQRLHTVSTIILFGNLSDYPTSTMMMMIIAIKQSS